MKKIWRKIQKPKSNKIIRNILIILIIYNAYIYTNFYFEALQNSHIRKVFDAPQIKSPDKNDTILVIAPHPDDETLGPGGYIKKATRAGAEVYVIIMTYGDGYKVAEEAEQKFSRKPESFIKFGEKRRLESISALTYLGVAKDHIYFLGFPDRGISHMWINNWKTPYRSLFTKAMGSPYRTSYIPDIPYRGKDLLEALTSIIKKVRPNIVFLPSPFDFHMDHWATYSFSISAILTLIEEKKIGIPSIYTYLVHYRNFPFPKGYYPKGALLPPKEMKKYNTEWRSYNIEDVEINKKEAILKYKSQLVLLKKLLLSFVRTNELWGEIPELSISVQTPKEIPDLFSDVLVDYMDSGANIRKIDIENIKRRLKITMTLQRNINKKYVYHLRFFIPEKNEYIKGIISYNKTRGKEIKIYNKKGESIKPANIQVYPNKNRITFTLPILEKQIIIGCDTNLYKKTYRPYIDTTGEFIIHLQ